MIDRRTAGLALGIVLAGIALAALPTGTGQSVDADLEIVRLDVEDPVHDAPHPTNVTVTVQNNGSGSSGGVLHFRYNVTGRSLTNDGRSDQPFNTTDPLGPGEKRTLSIGWEPSTDQIGNGTVLVLVSSPSEEDSEGDREEQPVFVKRYGLDATVYDDPEPLTLPARTTGFRVLLENTGNAPLVPDAAVTGPPPGAWRAEATPVDETLQPGDTALAYALVTPPDEDEDSLPDGSKERAEATWSARENPQANVTLALPNATVDRDPPEPYAYGVRAQVPDSVVPVNPQAPAITTVNVSNTGNVADVLSLEVDVEGHLADNVTVHVDRERVVLPANASVEVPIAITLSGDPPKNRRANLTLTARSVNDRVEPDAHAVASTDVRVAAPDLAIEELSWSTPVYRDDGALFVEVTVRNVGQGPAPATNASVEAFRGGFPFAQAQTSVPRLASSENHTATVRLPVGNLSGSYGLEARVDPADRVEEPVGEDNERRQDVFVRTAGLTLEPADPLDARPGQFIRYEQPPHVFYVRNDGNTREQARVQIASENGWTDEAKQVTLEAGERAPVGFSLLVPERPGTQSDAIRFTASLVNRSTVVEEASVTTRVIDDEPPSLVGIQLPENVTATEPFRVSTEWTDAVGVEQASMVLVSPTNNTNTITLTEHRPGLWTGNATVFELGSYEVRLRATDASEAGNTFEEVQPVSLRSSYERAPIVGFLDPEDRRTTRAGDPIPVSVEDDAGIASVRYEAGGESGELAAPFRVPTDGWSSGEHVVRVTAENRFGHATTIETNYTVDNEEPEILQVRLDPDDPQPGETMVITVSAEEGPSASRVEFRDESGTTVAETNLTAAGGGVFEGRASLGSNAARALVVVEDEVGNEATLEIDLDVGANLIPAPGPALALAASIAAAVGSARKHAGRSSRPP